MKVGLFFGSFNPIHTGHLIIASYMAHFTDLDKIWFVVSPHNPHKDKKGLINMYDRLEMTRLATYDYSEFYVSDIEFKLTQPSYTVDTLAHLQERYPDHEFSLIMGSDNLKSLKRWKNYEVILKNHAIYVYPRPGSLDCDLLDHPSVHITETPQMEISATFIRKALKAGKNIQFFVPDKVKDFIESKSLYANS